MNYILQIFTVSVKQCALGQVFRPTLKQSEYQYILVKMYNEHVSD